MADRQTSALAAREIFPRDRSWADDIDRALRVLDDDAHCFPHYFLKATFPRIGGRVVLVESGSDLAAVAFLFPLELAGSTLSYTARIHLCGIPPVIAFDDAFAVVTDLVGTSTLEPYDPRAPKTFAETHSSVGDFDFGRPNEAEAAAVARLQMEIWKGRPEDVYPVDMHSADFGLPTSLVARKDGDVVAFLFGLHRYAPTLLDPLEADIAAHELSIESQLLGVLEAHRGRRLGVLLKKVQAELALEAGVTTIHWTVDPLQVVNAKLNFNHLGGVAFDVYRNYYPFSNELNRTPASRFGITWDLRTPRARAALASKELGPGSELPSVPSSATRLNDAMEPLLASAPADTIAIEIPKDWTALQRDDLATALRWRQTTDDIFTRHVGLATGRYLITDLAADGGRPYLIGRRVEANQLPVI